MSAGHTPTPWHVAGTSRIRAEMTPLNDLIADVHWRNRDANAEFIVRAVNAHDDLVAALRGAREWLPPIANRPALKTALAAIDAALAKAESQS